MFHVFNTKTHQLEEFKPQEKNGNKVTLYGCGPTVYNYVHIGNLRAYIFYDLLNRYLRYKGYQVTFCMNLTDVDDKTIRDSQKAGKTLKEFTEMYTAKFFDDCSKLNILRPDIVVPATNEIDAMVDTIQVLLDKGVAYRVASGDVFFKISKFPQYGQMAGIDMDALKANADGRLADEYEKEDAQDFALWKAWTAKDGNNFWETKLGKGRPGWHIECSSIARKYLGSPVDFHIGGVDLIFPHHTNEIAQSEAAYGGEFVRYWMHNGHILVNGKKMAKSTGNFYILNDLLAKGYKPMAIRYEFIKPHYQLQTDFMEGNLDGNQKAVEKLVDFMDRLRGVSGGGGWGNLIESLNRLKTGFEAGMDDNLNTSVALASVFEFMNEVNKNFAALSKEDAGKIIDAMMKIDSVIGVIPARVEKALTDEQRALIDDRQKYRADKNWAEVDRIKKVLLDQGIEVRDTPTGPQVKFL